LFRPPYGEFDERSVDLTRALRLRFILWNVVSGDPDPTLSPEQMLASITPKLRNGAIVVFHGNGKGRHTRTVVEQLYEQALVKQALKPVTVSELLGGCGEGVANGRP
jgi:peptidoglycan/xylan/chitin deacetylase (PgdA/CDA1 family)